MSKLGFSLGCLIGFLLVFSACGGSDAKVTVSAEPTVVNSPTTLIVATVALPTPTVTAVPTVSIDPPTQALISRVDKLPLAEDGKMEIRNDLLGKSMPDPKLKYFWYSAAFGVGIASYYAHPNPDLLVWLKDLRSYIQATFPKEYENDRLAGVKNNFDPWEIKEKNY